MKQKTAIALLKETIGQLAMSQGFYSRLQAALNETDTGWKRLAEAAIEAGVNLADPVDIVIWLED